MDYRLLITGDDGTAGINGAILRRGRAGPGERAAVDALRLHDRGRLDRGHRARGARGRRRAGRSTAWTCPDVGQLSYFKDTEGNIFGALAAGRG